MLATASSSGNAMPLNHKTAPIRRSTPIPARPRSPLLPSASDNNKNGNANPRWPKSGNVATRVDANPNLKPSSSKRCSSSAISRGGKASCTSSAPLPSNNVQRSQSAERRRPWTPSRVSTSELRIGGSITSDAQKILTTSSRSLSVSFQGESFSLQVNVEKKKASVSSSPSPNRRAATIDRRFPELQQRWPARMRQSSTSFGVSELKTNEIPIIAKHLSSATTSDVESTSSSVSARGIVIPSRYLNETGVKLRRPFEQTDTLSSKTTPIPDVFPPSPQLTPISKSSSTISKHTSPNKIRISSSSTPSSSTIRVSSPIKFRSPSPKPSPSPSSKPPSFSRPVSPIPRLPSPNKLRPSSPRPPSPVKSRVLQPPSILTYNSGGKSSDKISESHLLRILHNRLLQWRFINARSQAASLAQTLHSERTLLTAHERTSSLRETVKAKRKELQSLTQCLKTVSILRGQFTLLKEFAVIDKEYACSLSGAAEALQASTLRLPLVGSARADLHSMKDAILSVVDVMQAMASSVCFWLTKVEEVNNQAKEIVKVAANERRLLNECLCILSSISSHQVMEYSMRIHVMQLSILPQD